MPVPEGAARPGDAAGHGRRGRRRTSLLVAAPALITVALVASALFGALGGEGRRTRSGTPSSGTARVPPPEPGWYTVTSVGGPPPQCLSVLYDDRQRWQLAADGCVPGDQYQRVDLSPAGNAPGVYRLKAQTPQGKVWCATVDDRADRSSLHMRPCGDEPLQRFVLQPAAQVKAGAGGRGVWRVVPEATRGKDMCVGVDQRPPGGYQTVHSACGRAGVAGFTFTPAAAPPGV